VKSAFLAGQPLNQELRIFIDQNAQTASSENHLAFGIWQLVVRLNCDNNVHELPTANCQLIS
jgi:hypothetical protein